jgi:ribonucleoside-diphosphate reductase alpha chain
MGYTTNPEIRIAKSLVDYIFRWLGLSFITGYREASLGLPVSGLKPDPEPQPPCGTPRSGATAESRSERKTDSTGASAGSEANGHSIGNGHSVANGHGAAAKSASADLLDRAGARMKESVGEDSSTDRNDQFARFQSDAPSCDNCGAITVRNGNCYLCHNCGNSMGCS